MPNVPATLATIWIVFEKKKCADLLRWKQWTARIFQREKKFCSCGWLITSWHNAVCVLFVENFVLKLPLIFSKANSVYLLSKCASVRYLKLNNNSAIFLPHSLPRIKPKCVMFAFFIAILHFVWISEQWILTPQKVYFEEKISLDLSSCWNIRENITNFTKSWFLSVLRCNLLHVVIQWKLIIIPKL